MVVPTLESLKAIDSTILTDVVRQDQRSATFEIDEWSVRTLSRQGVTNPDGLFLFSGHGHDEQGVRSWSIALKIIQNPGVEHELQSLWYGKREVLAAQSGLLASLPGPMVAPRCYRTSEDHDTGWIWMEHVTESVDSGWTLDHYALAARQIGLSEGAYLTGTSLPNYPWLSKGIARTWANDSLPDKAWDDPLVSQYFSSQVHERVVQLWEERDRFCDVLDRLPQVFSHLTLQRRNLLLRKRADHQPELVAVDWASCGYSAIGGGLSSMVRGSTMLFAVQPAAIADLDKVTFDAHMNGLREAGWTGDANQVRLGYAGLFAIIAGINAAPVSIAWTSGTLRPQLHMQFGISPEEFAIGWATVCEFALDLADEARQIMDRLGF